MCPIYGTVGLSSGGSVGSIWTDNRCQQMTNIVVTANNTEGI
jgi:hypothetical protein